MKKKYFMLFLLFAAALMTSFRLFADERESKEKTEKKNSFIILPIVFYTPETRWAGGAGGLITFTSGNRRKTIQPSSLLFVASYTQNKQFEISLEPELYLSSGSTILAGSLVLRKFPDKFYGIGNETEIDAEESYTPKQVSFDVSMQKRIWSDRNLYAGPIYSFDYYKFSPFDPHGQLATGNIPGSQGGTISGFGAVLRWDSRDNIFFPRKGQFFLLSATMYNSIFGSDYNYVTLKADLRAFIPLLGTHVLAFQGYLRAVSGSVPFMALSTLGGDEIMRGYNGSRYRDKILVAFQVEYRLPIWWRFGLVGFAGIGDVAPNISHLKLDKIKYSIGIGIRFNISSRERTNLRLDFGFGKGCSGNYLTGGEAF